MITLIATLTIKDGKMDEAIEILKETVPKIKESEPGCIEYIPHSIKGEENKILFYEKYKDKEALEFHSKNLPKSMEKLMPLLGAAPEIKICRAII